MAGKRNEMSTPGNNVESTQLVSLVELPAWRLEVEVGRSLCGSIMPQPKYSFRFETSQGPKVFECDFATLDKLKRELEANLELLRSSARLSGKKASA